MYTRIDQVVADLCVMGDEFNEKLQDDILGEIADLVDVKQILMKPPKPESTVPAAHR